MSLDNLSDELVCFYKDYDPYDYNDNYDSYDEAKESTYEMLSSNEKIDGLLYNIKEISEDLLKDKDDSNIKELYNRSLLLIDSLNEYKKTLDDEIVL